MADLTGAVDEFDALVTALRPYTKSPKPRMLAMLDALLEIDHRELVGDVVECGVWRGGNIILARRVAPHRMCWLFDTFEGMPSPGEFDMTRGGSRRDVPGKDAVSIAQVSDNLQAFEAYDAAHITFVKGRVEETLADPGNLPDAIALLRLDTDWYQSTRASLEVLWPRVVPGGIMIVDDYGHWLGCQRAVDEFFGEHQPPMRQVDYTCIVMAKE